MHTISSVLSTIERGDYAFKKDLQDVHFHVLKHPDSRKYLRFAFENKVYQFRVLPFGLNTAPRVFTRLGHTVAAYLHHQGISVIPYLDDWSSITLPPVSVITYTELNMVGLRLNEAKISELGASVTFGSGRASLPISKAREIRAQACRLSFQKILSYIW